MCGPEQETKLTTSRNDRVGTLGGRLLTYIKHSITFIDLNIPTINIHITKLQMIQIYTNKQHSFQLPQDINSLCNSRHRQSKLHITHHRHAKLYIHVNVHSTL